jgi:hypothetical protein
LIGYRACAGEVEVDEGADLGLERGEIGQAEFEESFSFSSGASMAAPFVSTL